MTIYRCKMCGGNLEVTEDESVLTCEFCGTKQTLPTAKDEGLQALFNRANVLRMKAEFDKAAEIYERIIQNDESEAEAYWGLILCKYGIEYVEDPTSYKRIPTCHRASYDAVVSDEDYKNAIRYSDAIQRQIYESEAETIDEIQKGIIATAQKEDPYDVFICYKETDEMGKRTQDSVMANDIYHQLTQEGFKVFYAAITLEDKLGSEYEPYIFSALNTSKVMVVLGTKPEYFSTVWVKNEWSRFLKLVKNSNGNKTLIPAYKEMDPYELPEEFSHLQALDMSKLGFMQDLIRGIKKLIATDVSKPMSKEAAGDVSNYLKRVSIYLEDGEWAKADEYCEKVLDLDPENAEAYLGKLMAELNVSQRNMLANCGKDYSNNNNYQKVVRFGDSQLVEELETYAKQNVEFVLQQSKINMFEFSLDDDGYSLDKLNDTSIESVVVPKEYRERPVSKIGSHAFVGCHNLTNIILPDSITSIGDAAFGGCQSITSITIPNGVTSIGELAFNGCDGLTSITIPEGVTSIGEGAFANCSNLTSITIPGSVTSIGKEAFSSNCDITRDIIIPGNVTSIGKKAFSSCRNIIISEGVTSIGEGAFEYCSNLTSITIPGSVTSIGKNAFRKCKSLTSITIPEGVTSIGEGAFEYCSNLTSITIPEGVTSIGDRAFADCYNLTSITIPGSVISIGESAFSKCKSLTSIIIPEGVNSIGDLAFADCSNLKSITIPASVSTIGGGVFNGRIFIKNVNYVGNYNKLKSIFKVNNYYNDRVIRCIDQAMKDRELLEAKRKQKEQLEEERGNLQIELANLKGIFSGKRRKEIETRLEVIDQFLNTKE